MGINPIPWEARQEFPPGAAPAASGCSPVTLVPLRVPRVPWQVPDSDDDPDPAEFLGQAEPFPLTAHPEAPECSGIDGGNVPGCTELELIAEPHKVTGSTGDRDWEHWAGNSLLALGIPP